MEPAMPGTWWSTLIAVPMACVWLASCRTAGEREPPVVILPRPVSVDGGQCEVRPLKWDCAPDKRCGPTWNDAVAVFRDVCTALKRDRRAVLPKDQQGRDLPIGDPELYENCDGLNILRFTDVDWSKSFYYDSTGKPVGYYATSMFGETCVGRAPQVSALKGASCTARNCRTAP